MTNPRMSTEEFLKAWHQAVADKDLAAMEAIIAEDATVRSPAYWNPKGPKTYVLTILGAVLEAFEDFTYDKEWVEGSELLLEFSTRVGDVNMRGIDRISLNADGQLQSLEVMIRPINALMVMAEHVTKYFEKSGLDLAG